MECQIKDITVYYEEVGSGRPLFALHGMPLDHRHMLNDLEPLFVNREGWRRIYPDLPGMGKTGAADWVTHQDDMLEIVLEFIDTVAPEERFVVVGTSYGGYLARGVVCRKGAQIDGVFINVPVVEADETKAELPPPKVIKEDAEFLAALGSDEKDMRDFIVVQSPELLQEFRKWFSPAGALADQAFLERLDQKNPSASMLTFYLSLSWPQL